jgi:hypothetical protein
VGAKILGIYPKYYPKPKFGAKNAFFYPKNYPKDKNTKAG